MTSRTSVQHYSPAVLDAVCGFTNLTIDQIRLGTLKRADTELQNFLQDHLIPLHPDDREALDSLWHQVRLAIGDE